MAKKKATKKFESKHLTDVLKRRKKAAPDRLKFKARLRKQAGKLKRSETAGNEPDKGDNGEKHKRGRIEEVDDGDLLTETFEALQPSNGAQPHHSSPSHLGKRKRSLNGGRENGAEVSKESEEDSDQRTSPAVEDALSAQEKHQAQLKALEENDPEFYEFLRENDEELLNFTYDRADDPSADVVQDEEKEKEITMAMVQRWRAGIDEHKSLRSAKEVVLGFRAAVKSDDAEKEFKYRITNSDGR